MKARPASAASNEARCAMETPVGCGELTPRVRARTVLNVRRRALRGAFGRRMDEHERARGQQQVALALHQYARQVASRQGLAVQETLRLVAAHRPERVELFLRLDAFADGAHAESLGERDDRLHQDAARGA